MIPDGVDEVIVAEIVRRHARNVIAVGGRKLTAHTCEGNPKYAYHRGTRERFLREWDGAVGEMKDMFGDAKDRGLMSSGESLTSRDLESDSSRKVISVLLKSKLLI